mmetsp:Transcript_133004/g.331866  ORF Transcript_133004/g.331866 Transcript_133004/m.331866 type:complete len:785 (+) Transcript_133004:53-2407(+)
MASQADIVIACGDSFQALDLGPDVLDYIASGIVDDNSLLPYDDFAEFVVPLIQDFCSDDASEAGALVRRLYDQLSKTFGQSGQTPAVQASAASAHPGGTQLGSLFPEETLPPPALRSLFPELFGCSRHVTEEVGVSRAKQAKAPARAKAHAKETRTLARQVGRCAAEKARLDAELEAACKTAASRSASEGINFNAAIKVGPFDLPHPSGCGSLLENAEFHLSPGRRYALIGRNGKGKSTLLRCLAARRVVGLPIAVRVHYVSQDVSFSADDLQKTPSQVVVDADVERRLLLEKAQAFEVGDMRDTEQYQSVLTQLEAIEAASAESRAVQMLSSLGFSDELQSRSLEALSGGWRVRVALAAALFARPDILMLDEPTNHLSIQAVLWLSHELSHCLTWRKRTVILVSHDRFFVDATCTDVLHISGVAQKLTHSRCNYSTWERARREQQSSWQHRSKVRTDEIAKLRKYLVSGQAAAGNTSQGSRKVQIQKLENEAAKEAEELAALAEDTDLPLTLLGAGRLERSALELQDVAFAYPGSEPLFRDVGCQPHEFNVDCKSRIVLVGENGNGKSTLLKLLLGELEPTVGTVWRNRNARFAVVNQHHADQIDLTLSPMQLMRCKFPGNRSDSWERGLRSHLEQCGIEARLFDISGAALSGGQRSRLAMAIVSFERPHILIMDEPTNNLDLASIDALAEAVGRFDGGVVLVSHDQHFVRRVAREVWVVEGGAVKPCRCGFEEYHAKLLARVAPNTKLASEALDEYLERKLVQSGGQISRLDLAREARALMR